jgi:hypothetical protein
VRVPPRAAAHALACLALACTALLTSFPLAAHLGTHLPGWGPGDNVFFLWNTWWLRTPGALTHPFSTPLLFAPFGASLVLDTHTALPAAIGATLLARLDVVTANNVLILGGLALNGLVAYALAWRLTSRVAASLLAGLVFGMAPYVAVHLLGHFNLVHAWTLPLSALAWIRLLDRPGPGRAALAGAALAATVYTDYYYAVYAVVFAAVWWLAMVVRVEWRVVPRAPRRRATGALLAGLLVADVALAIAVPALGGFTLGAGAWTLALRHGHNLRTGAWLLLLALALWRWRVRPRAARRTPAAPGLRAMAGPLGVAAAACGLLIAPVVAAAARLMLGGGYVTAPHLWLSGPAGVDLLAFGLGHPLHAAYGAWVRHAYDALHINVVEQCAWLGLVPWIAIAVLVRRPEPRALARPWLVVGAAFLVWALGPFLIVGGVNTGLVLPDAFLRSLPIVSNARIPGRAIVMVQLAAAMVCAAVAARGGLAGRTVAALAAVVVLGCWTAPFPLYALPPAGTVEARLRTDPQPGAVLELPLGIADGFGVAGRLDPRTLAWQTDHGRAIVGGFSARVSPHLRAAYLRDGVFARLLQLSADDPSSIAAPPWPDRPSQHLIDLGVRYVVINRDTAPARVVQFALTHLRLDRLATDGPRELYAVQPD